MMATPTLRQFKMAWSPPPQDHILINACSLYSFLQTMSLDDTLHTFPWSRRSDDTSIKFHHHHDVSTMVCDDFDCSPSVRRGDGDREQENGLTREEGRRGGAQLEAGKGEEFKGGKRLRGRHGKLTGGVWVHQLQN